MSARPLAEAVLLLALDETEPRNTRAHPTIRVAMRAGQVLDDVLAGAPLPDDKELQRTLRRTSHQCFEPVRGQLIARGELVVAKRGRLLNAALQRDVLGDPAARAPIAARAAAALDQLDAPAAWDAALLVLLDIGRLWPWTGLAQSVPVRVRLDGLADGSVVPPDLAPGVLARLAPILEREAERELD